MENWTSRTSPRSGRQRTQLKISRHLRESKKLCLFLLIEAHQLPRVETNQEALQPLRLGYPRWHGSEFLTNLDFFFPLRRKISTAWWLLRTATWGWPRTWSNFLNPSRWSKHWEYNVFFVFYCMQSWEHNLLSWCCIWRPSERDTSRDTQRRRPWTQQALVFLGKADKNLHSAIPWFWNRILFSLCLVAQEVLSKFKIVNIKKNFMMPSLLYHEEHERLPYFFFFLFFFFSRQIKRIVQMHIIDMYWTVVKDVGKDLCLFVHHKKKSDHAFVLFDVGA